MPEAATAVAPPRDATKEIGFGDAVREAIAEEMRRDPTVILMGEDVAEAGTTFKVLKGLVEEFGPTRIIDTPISEVGFTGLCVGAAMTGMRPIADIMFGDFLMLVMDQIGNQAAKIHYMSAASERPHRHSRNDGCDQAVGGAALAVAARLAEPYSRPEGRGALDPVRRERLFKAAVRDNNPVVFFEDKISYTKVKGLVPTEEYVIPLGVADVKREGSDLVHRDEQHGAGGARRGGDAGGSRSAPKSSIRGRRGRSTRRR